MAEAHVLDTDGLRGAEARVERDRDAEIAVRLIVITSMVQCRGIYVG